MLRQCEEVQTGKATSNDSGRKVPFILMVPRSTGSAAPDYGFVFGDLDMAKRFVKDFDALIKDCEVYNREKGLE